MKIIPDLQYAPGPGDQVPDEVFPLRCWSCWLISGK